MTGTDLVIAAQLSSILPPAERANLDGVIETARRLGELAGLDILIAGGEEIPDLYRALTGEARPARQVFLWYAALSDYPGMQPDHRTVNFRGQRSGGWGGTETWQEVGETFAFACPNHPEARSAGLDGLERILDEYPFEGVFLDKIRFPSPANGLVEVLACFCPHCRSAAAGEGLDLGEVQAMLARLPAVTRGDPGRANLPRAVWLADLLGWLPSAEQALLDRFLQFRARSITAVVEAYRDLAARRGVALALDLFSPGLAYLVGQDYPVLSRLAAWVKPMSYCFANGPAGLRLEIPQLARGFDTLLGLNPGAAEGWMQEHVPGLARATLNGIEQDGAPPHLVAAETVQAVRQMGDTPVYMGIEAVSLPAFQIHVTPVHVRQMLAVARSAGARGAVLSWDLLHMPEENLRVAREA